MQGLTIAFACVLCIGVFATRPVWSVVFYIVALAWYPANLTVAAGTVDFSLSRIVVIIIFAKIFFTPKIISSFKFMLLDGLMIAFFIGQICAGIFTTSLMALLENRFGAAFDTIFPYFMIRLLVRNDKELRSVLKGILIVSAPLALIGIFQSITGNNPFERLLIHASWGSTFQKMEMRWGLYRASVTFGVHILFGLFFGMLGPICASLLDIGRKKKPLIVFGLLMMCVGLFSSMSSGPWLCAILSVSFLIFYKFRKHWKPIVMMIVLGCAFVEVVSNRHFYDVFARYALNAATANYRSRLIQVAFFEGGMNGHWMFGYGLESGDPGWGPSIDGRGITDIVNHYILVMFLFGFPVMCIFVWIIFEIMRMLLRVYKRAPDNRCRWLVWCFFASMFGIVPTMCTVALTAQGRTVIFLLFGLASVVPGIILSERKRILLYMRKMAAAKAQMENTETENVRRVQ